MKTSISHVGNGDGERNSDEIVDNLVVGEDTVQFDNNDNFEWGGEMNEADLPVVNFHSVPDEIMGIILSMLDGYDFLKGPIRTCQRFIEIFNNPQIYCCPSLIQRPTRTCGRIHCDDLYDFLNHERFKQISKLRLPIGVDGDITLQRLKGVLPNLVAVYSARWIPVSGIVVNVAVVQNGGNVIVHQAVEQYKHTHQCNPFQAWIKWESNGRRELIDRSSIIGVATRTGRQQRTRVLTQFFHEEFGYYNQYNNI